jgi:type IV secretion system protein VirD4
LIVTPEGGDPHLCENARMLVHVLILLVLTFPQRERDLIALRQLLTLSAMEFSGPPEERRAMLFAMLKKCEYEAARHAGFAFEGVAEPEISRIFLAAQSQTEFLESRQLKRVFMAGSKPEFRLADLKQKKTTIYLCLPEGRIGDYSPWLRVVISLALTVLERERETVADIMPLIVLDEFAALGHMKCLETSLGSVMSVGAKLWVVARDLTQIQRLYKESWETFIASAGVVMFFANTDITTLNYVSSKLGARRAAMDQPAVPLLLPAEIEEKFARDTNRILLFIAGEAPVIGQTCASVFGWV